MIDAVKEKKPHWMELYKKADKKCGYLEEELARQGRIAELESARLNAQYANDTDEIAFLRELVNDLTATLKHAVKVQG